MTVALVLGGATAAAIALRWISRGAEFPKPAPVAAPLSAGSAAPLPLPTLPCTAELTLPLPACLEVSARELSDLPLLAPQVVEPGSLRMVLPAVRFQVPPDGVKSGADDDFLVVDISARGDRVVQRGHCPSDSAYLAAHTSDEAGRLHFLCLEYAQPSSAERRPVADPGLFERSQYCRGPRAYYGIARNSSEVAWRPVGWLPDLCEGRIRDGVVLAVTRDAPLLAYCAPHEQSCSWRVAVLRERGINHALERDSRERLGSTRPHAFFVQDGSLNSIVPVPDPNQHYSQLWASLTLRPSGQLDRTLLPAVGLRPATPDSFPRRSIGRAPEAITAWTSADGKSQAIALPLAPLARTELDWAPLIQPLSLLGALLPAGYRVLGPGVSVAPEDDDESDFLRLRLPFGSTLEVRDRTLHWVRVSCAGGCVVSFRYLDDERSASERYPGALYVLRFSEHEGAEIPGQLRAGTQCAATPSGNLSCQNAKGVEAAPRPSHSPAPAESVASNRTKSPSRQANSHFFLEVTGTRELFRNARLRWQDPEVFYLEESGQLTADGRRIETWIATTRAALERFKARAKAAGFEVKVYENR